MIAGAQLYTLRDFCKTTEDLESTIRRVAEIGYKAVQMAIDKLAGKEVSDVGIAGVWYTAENIDEQKDKNIFYMG